MAPSGPAPAMVGNEMSLSRPVSRRKRFQRLDGVDLGEPAARRFALEPGEEAHDRGAVADMGGARAGDLDGVLHRLHQRDRIGAARHLAAAAGHQPRDRVGGGRLVEPHGPLGRAERRQRGREIGRLAHLGELLEAMAHVVGELAAIDEERRPPLRAE